MATQRPPARRAAGRRRALGLAGAALAFAAGRGAAACLPYEPAQVVLVGRARAVPDPGRAPGLVLRLDRAACTQGGAGTPGEPYVRAVRLVFPRGSAAMAGVAGRRVAVSGSMYRVAHGRGEAELRMLVAGLGRLR